VPKPATPTEKLVFYVDSECLFSNKGKCSYYTSEKTQKEAGSNAKKVWKKSCCPIVYLQTDGKRFIAFCPTRGGAWGEQLPTLGSPGLKAVKVELEAPGGEPWEQIVEKAAKMAVR